MKDFLELNINDKLQSKQNLSYLSWAFAWAEVIKVDERANYEVLYFDGKPYIHDAVLGYMVATKVTINGLTRSMWLPVLNSSNKAMKDSPYTITFKNGNEAVVDSATMFDINTSLMRCLTKNIAMFGLGLYVYAGEDIPEADLHFEQQKVVARSILAALVKNGKMHPKYAVNACMKYLGVEKILDCKDKDKMTAFLSYLENQWDEEPENTTGDTEVNTES